MEKLIGQNLAIEIANIIERAFEVRGLETVSSKLSLGREIEGLFDDDKNSDFEICNIEEMDFYQFVSQCLNDEFLELDYIKLSAYENLDYDGDTVYGRVYASIGFMPRKDGFGSGFCHDSFIGFSFEMSPYDKDLIDDALYELRSLHNELDDAYSTCSCCELEDAISSIRDAFNSGFEELNEIIANIRKAMLCIEEARESISDTMDYIQDAMDKIDEVTE